jgi:flagellar motor component MotA
MKWTTSKILSYIIAIGGIVYGFIYKDSQAMMLMVAQAVTLIGGKTYLQHRSS